MWGGFFVCFAYFRKKWSAKWMKKISWSRLVSFLQNWRKSLRFVKSTYFLSQAIQNQIYICQWLGLMTCFETDEWLLTFSLLSPSSMLKLTIIYETLWSVRNGNFSVQIDMALLLAFETFPRDIGVPSFLVRKVENESFPWSHNLGHSVMFLQTSDKPSTFVCLIATGSYSCFFSLFLDTKL